MMKRELSEAARQELRSYQKQWRERNKGRKAEYNRRYWEKKAAERAARRGSS